MQQMATIKPLRHNGIIPVEKCRAIIVHLFYGNNLRKDNTNTVESVHDLLVDFGILKDDCHQVTGTTIQIPYYRKDKPGCRIEIVIDDDGRESKIPGKSNPYNP